MRRPISIILISLLFVISGITGIIYHASELNAVTEQPEIIWTLIIRLLAIVAGVFAWRGSNWARWLMVCWMAYHVTLSFWHDMSMVITHAVFLALVLLAVFNRHANAWFASRTA